MRCATTILASAMVALSPTLEAQGPVDIRVASFFERYDFDNGLAFNDVSELTIPVGLNLRLGRFGDFSISSGYVRIELTSSNTDALPHQTLSGALDTEARLSWNALPGKLVIFANGSLPTGVETVDPQQLAVLGVIASDIIGFATSNLGNGGGVGGGFAGALPLGRFALGLGGNFVYRADYRPVSTDTENLQPGNEIRGRLGLEGPLGRQSYLRIAGILAFRAKDEVGGVTQNGVGNRLVGYGSFEQGFGSTRLTLYAYDVFRSDPQVEPTAVGAALLPRGNLFASGFLWSFPLGRDNSVTPRAEFRNSSIAPDTSDATFPKLRLAGRSLRGGIDLRRNFGRSFSLVLQGDGAFGFVVQGGRNIDFKGFRVALHARVTP